MVPASPGNVLMPFTRWAMEEPAPNPTILFSFIIFTAAMAACCLRSFIPVKISRKYFVNFSMNNTTIHNLTRQFSDTLDGEPWIDETYSKKITTLTEEQAYTRPRPDVHSVAELVSHVLVWRYSVLSILKGSTRTITMDSPDNWKDNDTLRKEGWTELKEELYKSQQDIIAFLEQQDDDYLQKLDKEGHSYLYYAEGLIHHDMYHLGQIGLVIKMLSPR